MFLFYVFCTFLWIFLWKLLYEHLIKPRLLLAFYKKQRILTFESPSYEKLCNYNLNFYGDSLYHQKTLLHTADACKAYALKYGNSVLLTVVDPNLKKDFFMNHSNKYEKYQPHFNVVQPIIGHNNLLLKESNSWKTSRKLLSKVFNFEFIKKLAPLVAELSSKYLQENPSHEVNLLIYFEKLTLKVAMSIVLGTDILEIKYDGKNIDEYLYSLIEETIRLHRSSSLNKFLKKPAFKKKALKFEEFLAGKTAEKFKQLKNKEKSKEFNEIHTVLDILSQENVELSDVLLELVTVMVAATDTTGHFLTHICICLKKNKEIYEKLLAEIKENFPNKENSDFSYEKVQSLPYLEGVVQEILRIYSPIPDLFPRVAKTNHKLGDIMVKKGTIVNVSLMTSNNDEQIFQESYKIIPERWIKNDPKYFNLPENNPYYHLPFSSGERNCIGQHLAILEVKIVLIKFLLAKKLEIRDEKNIKWIRRFLYEPAEPVLAKVSSLNS